MLALGAFNMITAILLLYRRVAAWAGLGREKIKIKIARQAYLGVCDQPLAAGCVFILDRRYNYKSESFHSYYLLTGGVQFFWVYPRTLEQPFLRW